MTKKFVNLLTAMMLTVVWGCGDSPTAPSGGTQPTQQSQQTTQQTPVPQSSETPSTETPTPEQTTQTPQVPPTTVTPTPTPPSTSTQSCVGLVSYETSDGVTWKFRNNAPYDCDALVAMWEMPVPYPQTGWSNQTKVDIKHMRLAAGQSGSLTLMLPPCGKLWQSDFYPGVTLQMAGPNGENIHPENLVYPNVTHRFGSTPACPPPPPPPTCEVVSLHGSVVQTAIDDLGVGVRASAKWDGEGTVTVDWGNGQKSTLTTANRSALMIYQRGDADKKYSVTFTYNGTSAGVCVSAQEFLVPKKPVPPPPPPSGCVGPWTYTGTNPFSLPNAGASTELGYVHAYVSSLLVGPVKSELSGTKFWNSDGNYPVVIVKAGTNYWLYTNVVTGQLLQTDKDISHVARFTCP